jgi:hypothetical protein
MRHYKRFSVIFIGCMLCLALISCSNTSNTSRVYSTPPLIIADRTPKTFQNKYKDSDYSGFIEYKLTDIGIRILVPKEYASKTKETNKDLVFYTLTGKNSSFGVGISIQAQPSYLLYPEREEEFISELNDYDKRNYVKIGFKNITIYEIRREKNRKQ